MYFPSCPFFHALFFILSEIIYIYIYIYIYISVCSCIGICLSSDKYIKSINFSLILSISKLFLSIYLSIYLSVHLCFSCNYQYFLLVILGWFVRWEVSGYTAVILFRLFIPISVCVYLFRYLFLFFSLFSIYRSIYLSLFMHTCLPIN